MLNYCLYIAEILFAKFLTDYIVYEEIVLKKIIIYVSCYYLFIHIFEYIVFLIDNIYNRLEGNKLKIYIQRIIYNKINLIDISFYDEKEFKEKYSRAVWGAQDRMQNSITPIILIFQSLLYIAVSISLLSKFDFIYIFVAVIIAIYNVIVVFVRNKADTKKDFIQIPNLLRSGLVEYVLSAYQYVKELKLFSIGSLLIERHKSAIADYRNIEKTEGKKIVALLSVSNFFMVIIRGFVAIYTIYKIVNGLLTIGDFALVSSLVFTLGGNFSSVTYH
jgi:ABC-type transport system involved in Fe-S cluster assembly fused permease/ATPase subunit